MSYTLNVFIFYIN